MTKTFFKLLIFSVILLSPIEVGFFNTYSHVSFQESDEAIVNPYKGYVPWASGITAESMPEPDVSLAFVTLHWKDFEPIKDFYAFDAFERINNLAYLRQNNIKLIIRVVSDYPTSESHMDIPRWLYDEMGGGGTYYNNDGLVGFVPDYTNQYFIQRHELMIKALAERYDQSGDIAFIQIGSLGHWGEWHNIAVPGAPFPSADVTDVYVKHYLTAFTQTKLQMRRPYDIAKTYNIGLYNDMTGHKEATRLWLDWIKDHSMTNFYIHSPSGGEFASTYGLESYFDKMYVQSKQLVIESRMTYIMRKPPNVEKLKKNVDDLLKVMGYRFVMRDVLYSSEISQNGAAYAHFRIDNVGVAPFYYEWPFYCLFYDQDGNLAKQIKLDWDVRKILPGKQCEYTFNEPLSLPTGEYTIKFGLFNPYKNTADVRFANTEAGSDGLLTIGDIKIKE